MTEADDFDALLERLDDGEPRVAVSRMAEVGRTDADLERASIHLDGGGASEPIVVTDRRVVWAQHRKERRIASIGFETVRSYTEVTKAHRYALILEHDPIDRVQWVPAHRFLWWSWGDAEAARSRTRTGFAFSHREAKAAVAIRSAMGAMRTPARPPIVLRAGPRREPTAYAVLTSDEDVMRRDATGRS